VASPYIEQCETLQDACPHEPLEYVTALLTRALGRPWSNVFSHVDPEPLGAASIGQVHRAVLRDGRVVAVKVQYPGVETLFRGDIKTMRAFCELAQPEQLPMLDEVERAFLTEFDYVREAEALAAAADACEAGPFARRVVVPRPLKELCTRDVLVMQFLEGEKLVDALRRQYAALAAARGTTLAALREEWAAAAAAAGTDGGKPPGAPAAAPAWRRLALRLALRASDAAHNAPLRCRNLALRATGRSAAVTPLRSTPVPVDADDILALLAAVHARNIFVDGLYNGDSHPGTR
jgi:aarF domain-containing kinase